ncbi:PIN domain-containing protein [Gluconacetobacter tumulisoli]|uniref:Uncharacterized protein n=1 Tax=Gluconacetobacter tumulisoli TaxID=1286189 RepID=A0A7W4K9E8_9PROT|nr:hypothetical protein [Gluconacetobacter tumulisoli]MBB2202791.1 hypothetical protein [Gluconacetobacter tumulisoli]
MSVVTIAETAAEIEKVQYAGHAAKAGRLGEWLEMRIHLYARRSVPISLPISPFSERRQINSERRGISQNLVI